MVNTWAKEDKKQGRDPRKTKSTKKSIVGGESQGTTAESKN